MKGGHRQSTISWKHKMEETNVRQRKLQPTPTLQTSEEFVKPTSKSAGWTLLGQLVFTLFSVPFVYAAYVYFLVDDVIVPNEIILSPPPALDGPLALNNILEKADHLFENQVKGPESVLYHKGHLYTGTADGRILHIDDKDEIHEVVKLGKPPCGRFEDEHHCGRPLGMRFDSDGYLIVLDAYLGLFKVNVATGDYMQYLSSNTPIDGAKPKFLNDLDVAKDGSIYFTDSSTRWPRRNFPYCLLESDNTGRLLRYNPATNTTEVLLKGLHFANGVQIAPNQEYLLFCETLTARIWKYHLTGQDKGKAEVLIDNLPGFPDNIRKSHGGKGYWVALPMCRDSGSFSMLDYIMGKPQLRNFIAKVFPIKTLLSLSVACGRVLQITEQGEILRALHDPTGKVLSYISEVEDHHGLLYFGSFKMPYLAKLDLNKL